MKQKSNFINLFLREAMKEALTKVSSFNFKQGCLVERQFVEKSVKKNALCRKALGRKKGRKAISIVCLKTSHMVEMLILSFDHMTRFEANDQIG